MSSFLKRALLLIWLTVITTQAFGFDEHGFHTGMTVEEVRKQLPKGHRLEKLLDEPEIYEAFDLNKLTRKELSNQKMFIFCKGLLTAYSHPLDPGMEFLPSLQSILKRLGQPTSLDVHDKMGISPNKLALDIKWWVAPDRISLSFAPYAHTNKGDNSPNAVASISFSTPNPDCGNYDVPARKSREIVPFDTLSNLTN